MMGNAHRDALFGFTPVDQVGGLEASSQGVSRDTGDLAKMQKGPKLSFGEVGRELLKRRELTHCVADGEGCVGHAGEGAADRGYRGGIERVVTWVQAASHGRSRPSGGLRQAEGEGTSWGLWGR